MTKDQFSALLEKIQQEEREVREAGTKHIRSFKSYTEYLVWLLREKRNGFRILCHNCNRAIWRCGSCPHGNGI